LNWSFAILPEGSVRDEGVFFTMLIILGALVGLAIYMRYKRRKEPDYPEK
jgi:LPXTG-motif cell wall-anchored protein